MELQCTLTYQSNGTVRVVFNLPVNGSVTVKFFNGSNELIATSEATQIKNGEVAEVLVDDIGNVLESATFARVFLGWGASIDISDLKLQ